MIHILPGISIREDEICERFVRSSGPGGQHVNKVSTAVELRFDVLASSLPAPICERLEKLAGNRLNDSGTIVIEADRFRSQILNRNDAVNRLVLLIRKAAVRPVKRKPTSPTAASGKRRMEKKRRRSSTKQLRNSKVFSDE
jgi:ribosome-associated protein